MSAVGTLDVDVSWSMRTFEQPATTSVNATALSAIQTRADVVVDSFLDYNLNNAGNATAAKVEVMIFFAAYGGMVPAGYTTLTANSPVVAVDGYNL